MSFAGVGRLRTHMKARYGGHTLSFDSCSYSSRAEQSTRCAIRALSYRRPRTSSPSQRRTWSAPISSPPPHPSASTIPHGPGDIDWMGPVRLLHPFRPQQSCIVTTIYSYFASAQLPRRRGRLFKYPTIQCHQPCCIHKRVKAYRRAAPVSNDSDRTDE